MVDGCVGTTRGTTVVQLYHGTNCDLGLVVTGRLIIHEYCISTVIKNIISYKFALRMTLNTISLDNSNSSLTDPDMSLNCLAVLPLPAPLGRLGARKGIRSVKTIAPKRRP